MSSRDDQKNDNGRASDDDDDYVTLRLLYTTTKCVNRAIRPDTLVASFRFGSVIFCLLCNPIFTNAMYMCFLYNNRVVEWNIIQHNIPINPYMLHCCCCCWCRRVSFRALFCWQWPRGWVLWYLCATATVCCLLHTFTPTFPKTYYIYITATLLFKQRIIKRREDDEEGATQKTASQIIIITHR